MRQVDAFMLVVLLWNLVGRSLLQGPESLFVHAPIGVAITSVVAAATLVAAVKYYSW